MCDIVCRVGVLAPVQDESTQDEEAGRWSMIVIIILCVAGGIVLVITLVIACVAGRHVRRKYTGKLSLVDTERNATSTGPRRIHQRDPAYSMRSLERQAITINGKKRYVGESTVDLFDTFLFLFIKFLRLCLVMKIIVIF